MNEKEKLSEVAHQLKKWADEAEEGGWSTQHVKPMRNKAIEIFAFLGRGKTDDPSTR